MGKALPYLHLVFLPLCHHPGFIVEQITSDTLLSFIMPDSVMHITVTINGTGCVAVYNPRCKGAKKQKNMMIFSITVLRNKGSAPRNRLDRPYIYLLLILVQLET